MGFIDRAQFEALIADLPRNDYRDYLEIVATEGINVRPKEP